MVKVKYARQISKTWVFEKWWINFRAREKQNVVDIMEKYGIGFDYPGSEYLKFSSSEDVTAFVLRYS